MSALFEGEAIMRSLIQKISFVVCCVTVLSACAQSSGLASRPQSRTVAPAPQNDPPLEMKMALSSMGVFGQEVAGNEDGAYTILSNTQDYSARILYYDYATRQMTYLSNQVVVTNDEENPGWLEDVFGGAVPLAVNEKLYIVKYGKSPIPRIHYEGSPSFLLEMETNAANRKKLTVPRGQLLKNNTGIAADGKNLYLLLTDYDEKALQITNITLCKTNFDKNAFDPLLSLGIEKDTQIVGVFPEGLILQRTFLPSEYADGDQARQISHFNYELQLYSIPENSLVETGFTWKQGDLSFVLGQGLVYYVKTGTAQLCAYDLQSKTRRVLVENLLTNIPAESTDAQIILMGELYDDHISLKLLDGDNSADYSYSLHTQKIFPLLLSFDHEGGSIPVSIASENDLYFLVNSGFNTLHRLAIGTDGSYYTVDSKITQYSLIKKEDYWNSLPHFISFDEALLEAVR